MVEVAMKTEPQVVKSSGFATGTALAAILATVVA
jgi:hypothetical protein